jgi:hypothetical protein
MLSGGLGFLHLTFIEECEQGATCYWSPVGGCDTICPSRDTLPRLQTAVFFHYKYTVKMRQIVTLRNQKSVMKRMYLRQRGVILLDIVGVQHAKRFRKTA